jgi:hypothetical protein
MGTVWISKTQYLFVTTARDLESFQKKTICMKFVQSDSICGVEICQISFGYVCLTCRSLMFQPTPLVRMSYQAFGNNLPPFYCPKSSARRESFIVPIHLLWSNQAASAPSLFVNLYIYETMMMWFDYLPIW